MGIDAEHGSVVSAMVKDLDGRNILITGANTGIGKATALALAGRGARLWLACRSLNNTQPAIDDIKRATGNDAVEFLPLDLSDLDSVRECGERFVALGQPLHVLINNAGVAGQRGITRQGFELHFGVNHLGHFLLTNLLLDTLKKSAPARIVIVSSKSHTDAKGIDFDALRQSTPSIMGLPEYAVSKLANVLHARELARRLEGTGVTTYALHPGVIASDVWRRIPWPVSALMKMFMKSNEEGAQPSIRCAADPAIATHTGRYYDEGKEREPARVARDPELAAELWQHSEGWTPG